MAQSYLMIRVPTKCKETLGTAILDKFKPLVQDLGLFN